MNPSRFYSNEFAYCKCCGHYINTLGCGIGYPQSVTIEEIPLGRVTNKGFKLFHKIGFCEFCQRLRWWYYLLLFIEKLPFMKKKYRKLTHLDIKSDANYTSRCIARIYK